MYHNHFKMEEAVAVSAGAAPAPVNTNIAATPTQGAGGDGGTPVSWRDTLSDDIKNDPSLQMYKDVQSLAKSHVSAQALIGKEKAIIPNEKSTDEEWANFYRRTGRPESPDKYEFKLPDGQKMDENFAKAFKQAAFEAGATPKQVQRLVDFYAKASSDSMATAQAAQDNAAKAELDAHIAKVGGQEKFMSQVDTARRAVNTVVPPGFIKLMNDTKIGDKPETIEFFEKLAGMMKEDQLRDGTGVAYTEDPAVIEREIQELESKMFADLNNTNKNTWVKQRNDLWERLVAARTPRQ